MPFHSGFAQTAVRTMCLPSWLPAPTGQGMAAVGAVIRASAFGPTVTNALPVRSRRIQQRIPQTSALRHRTDSNRPSSPLRRQLQGQPYRVKMLGDRQDWPLTTRTDSCDTAARFQGRNPCPASWSPGRSALEHEEDCTADIQSANRSWVPLPSGGTIADRPRLPKASEQEPFAPLHNQVEEQDNLGRLNPSRNRDSGRHFADRQAFVRLFAWLQRHHL